MRHPEEEKDERKKSICLHQPNVLWAMFPRVPWRCIMQVVSLLAMNNAWKYHWPGHDVGIPALGEVHNSLWRARAAFVFVGAAAAIISSASLLMATTHKHGAEANNKADPARATNGRGGFSLSAFIGKAQNTWCTAGANLAEPLGGQLYLLVTFETQKLDGVFPSTASTRFSCQCECWIRKVMIMSMRTLERHLSSGNFSSRKRRICFFLWKRSLNISQASSWPVFGKEGLYSRVSVYRCNIRLFILRCAHMLYHRNITAFWANSLSFTLSPLQQ